MDAIFSTSEPRMNPCLHESVHNNYRIIIHIYPAFPHISLSQKQQSKMAKEILSLKQLKYGAEMDETDHPVLSFALIK